MRGFRVAREGQMRAVLTLDAGPVGDADVVPGRVVGCSCNVEGVEADHRNDADTG